MKLGLPRGRVSDAMPPGFPPAAAPSPALELAAGPSEMLAVGATGLIVLPGVEAALTFSPPGSDADAPAWQCAWEAWVAGWFVPVLAPALVAMADLAARERVRELRAADLDLAARFPPEIAARLRESGRRLLSDLHGARSTRWLSRFEGWAASGETPALFPTLFAARSALFHLPPRPMLDGYARLEWRAASGSDQGAPTDALTAVAEGLWRPGPHGVAA